MWPELGYHTICWGVKQTGGFAAVLNCPFRAQYRQWKPRRAPEANRRGAKQASSGVCRTAEVRMSTGSGWVCSARPAQAEPKRIWPRSGKSRGRRRARQPWTKLTPHQPEESVIRNRRDPAAYYRGTASIGLSAWPLPTRSGRLGAWHLNLVCKRCRLRWLEAARARRCSGVEPARHAPPPCRPHAPRPRSPWGPCSAR